jgi:DNA-binding CsgD family transcriptional regulator
MSPERVRREMVRLAHSGLGVREFSNAAARVLRRAVPFEGLCMLTLDPATLLPTREFVENGLPADAVERLTEIEIGEPDYNKFDALARAVQPVASLSDATHGSLDDSLRQRELRRPSGFEDELRAMLLSDAEAWGALTLLRERGRPHFTDAEVRRVASVTNVLADGLRQALVFDELMTTSKRDVGLLVLADDNTVELANAAGRDLLDDLRPAAGAGRVPIVVQAVAARARRVAADEKGEALLARARVSGRSGRWLVVHGATVDDGVDRRVAVVLEAAQAPELAPLIAAAYGLSARERDVTQLVAQGFNTSEIAGRLHLSPWTVQDHLKSIFGKTGTGTRGELVARVFFDHYAARLSQ